MATLAAQSISRSGLEPVPVAAAGGGDKFTPSDRTFVTVANGSGGDITVTVVSVTTVIGLAVADSVTVVTAGESRDIGPFPHEHFAAASDGLAAITYSGVTSLTVAVKVLSTP